MKLRSLYSGLYLFSYKGIPQKVHVFLDLLLRLNPHKERKKPSTISSTMVQPPQCGNSYFIHNAFVPVPQF
jgi:hypothetical protein